MATLLLELFSEEIPARMQARAAEDLKKEVTDRLNDARLAYSGVESLVTPRRLALVIEGLPDRQPDVEVEKKGPKVGAPDKAVEGFLKSVGMTLDECEQRETPKGAVWFAVRQEAGRETTAVLADLLPGALGNLFWAKSMRWGQHRLRWVRPLHRILCLLDDAVVPFEFGHLRAGAATEGHRFMAPDAITVSGVADYKEKLRAARVMLGPAERRTVIREAAEKLANDAGLVLEDDPGLLAENAGLNEWPVPLMGGFDEDFLAVPEEALVSAMRKHQKYFALRDDAGKLAPRFVLVSNIETDDGGAAIVAGNERVLRARLSDSRFFWDQDLKAGLEAGLPALDGMVFHAKLGSLGDKVERIAALAGDLCQFIDGADKKTAVRAAKLAKADLVSEMVGEFPDLQGVMGAYYARHAGEPEAVANAIAEHYRPQGPGDTCPSAPESVAVALADKIDTLVGFFAIDEKPTGSKDPFALRRAALGVIRLILENKLRLPLMKAFADALSRYGDAVQVEGRAEDVASDLLAFFADRLKVHLREKGVRHDLVSAVFALGGEDDLVRLMARVDALASFLNGEDGANLLTAYKRAANILRIEEKKDGASYAGEADVSRLVETAEKDLVAKINVVGPETEAALGSEDFVGAMQAMAVLRAPVDTFFDDVTVNADDAALRENRLKILSGIRGALDRVADFSQIEG